MHNIALLLGCLILAGCPDGGDGATSAAGSANSSGASHAPASSTASSGRSATPRERSPFAGSWRGAFTAERGAVTVPSGVPYRAWEKDPGGALGEGAIELTIADDGAISGSLKGALGELVVAGRMEDGALAAGLSPSDPDAENAMTGVLTGDAKGEAIAVELRVSSGDGRVVRKGTSELRRQAR
jgi:hypothetical protein